MRTRASALRRWPDGPGRRRRGRPAAGLPRLPHKAGVITGDVAWNLLKFLKAKGFAIPAFNCTSSSVCNAVLEAGAKIGRPVMIQFSEGGSAFFGGKALPIGKKEASILGACAGALCVCDVFAMWAAPMHVRHTSNV